ncbi:MAG: glycoside hydrolase family 28 protein [Planctomycetota bacterium]
MSDTGILCITDFGAVADGETKCTEAFEAAIAAMETRGGGTLIVPPGTFYTGPIHLTSNMTLQLEPGSTILFSDDIADYPFVETRWAGTELWIFSPLLFGKDLANVTITGKGIIDGNPRTWWEYFDKVMASDDTKPLGPLEEELAKLNKGRYENTDAGGGGLFAQFLRPPLLQLNNCRDVRLDGFVVQNSPFWNTHLVYCTNVTVHDVTFRNPNGAPNGDGLDLDSCCGVRVSNCCFDTNDDCLALKSGMNDDGFRVGKPTENVTITNCTMLRGHGGVVMGSDGAGGVKNVTVSNCVFIGTDRGIRLKSNRGRYSVFQDLRFENIIMQDVMCPLVFNLYYTCGATERTRHIISDPNPRPIRPATPWIRNVHIANVTARGHMATAGVLVGLPERPIENVTLDNVEIEGPPRDFAYCAAMAFGLPEMNGQGLWGRHVRGLTIRNSRITACSAEALTLINAEDIELTNVRLEAHSDTPVVRFDNVTGAHVGGCRILTADSDTVICTPGRPAVVVTGGGSDAITFHATRPALTADAISRDDSVAGSAVSVS